MVMGRYGTPEEADHDDIEKHPDSFQNSKMYMHGAGPPAHETLVQGTPHYFRGKSISDENLFHKGRHGRLLECRGDFNPKRANLFGLDRLPLTSRSRESPQLRPSWKNAASPYSIP